MGNVRRFFSAVFLVSFNLVVSGQADSDRATIPGKQATHCWESDAIADAEIVRCLDDLLEVASAEEADVIRHEMREEFESTVDPTIRRAVLFLMARLPAKDDLAWAITMLGRGGFTGHDEFVALRQIVTASDGLGREPYCSMIAELGPRIPMEDQQIAAADVRRCVTAVASPEEGRLSKDCGGVGTQAGSCLEHVLGQGYKPGEVELAEWIAEDRSERCSALLSVALTGATADARNWAGLARLGTTDCVMSSGEAWDVLVRATNRRDDWLAPLIAIIASQPDQLRRLWLGRLDLYQALGPAGKTELLNVLYGRYCLCDMREEIQADLDARAPQGSRDKDFDFVALEVLKHCGGSRKQP